MGNQSAMKDIYFGKNPKVEEPLTIIQFPMNIPKGRNTSAANKFSICLKLFSSFKFCSIDLFINQYHFFHEQIYFNTCCFKMSIISLNSFLQMMEPSSPLLKCGKYLKDSLLTNKTVVH